MAIPSQRSQRARIKALRSNNRRSIAAANDPTVFYRGRDVITGNHFVELSDGSIIPVFLSGNAQPFQGQSMLMVGGEEGGLPLVMGPSVAVEERRIARIPREEYAAAVLFTKQESLDFGNNRLTVSFNGNTERSLSGWSLTGFDETDVIVTESIFDITPGQVYAFSGTGNQRVGPNVDLVATFDAVNVPEGSIVSASGSISIDAGRDTTAGSIGTIFSDNIVASASLIAGDSDSTELLAREASSPSSWTLNFGLSIATGVNNNLNLSAGALFVDDNGNPDNSLEGAVSFSASFSFTFVDVARMVEFWIGGDRTALLLWELTSMVDYMEGGDITSNAVLRSIVETDRATTTPYNESGTLVDPGGGTVGPTAATLNYSISVSTSNFQMSGAGSAETRTNPNGSVDNPAGAAGWEVNARASLGTLGRGIYRISGFFGGSLSGDFNTAFRLDVDPLGTETISLHGRPRAFFNATWGPTEFERSQFVLDTGIVTTRVATLIDTLSGSFSRIIDVTSSFTLTIDAEIGRAISGINIQNTINQFPEAGRFGGGLNLNMNYGITIDQVPEAYLAASKNFLYAFIRNSEVARYIKIATAGIEESTDYAAGQTIASDENDWRNSRATFEDPSPDDPDPCRQANRFNDFVNLQQNNRISINQSQQIDGTSLQDRLVSGQETSNAVITVQSATVEGSSCRLGEIEEKTVKDIQSIVPADNTEAIDIVSIVPHRRR